MGKKPRAKDLVNQLLAKTYADAMEAKKNGEPVGWSTSVFPQEFPETFGLKVVYPENHAAAVAARGESLELCEVAENKGYSIDLCSYARVNLAYLDLKKCNSLNMPQPDFILCCNNICNQVIKWYENIAKELNIPMIMLDTPFNTEYDVTQESIDYMKGQFKVAIKQLEEISGKKFDQKRFEEVMKISGKTGKWWKKAMSYSNVEPSPMNGFEMFNYMAIQVCARGRKETAEVFKVLAHELEENIKTGKSTFRGEEKYRIMLEGIPCWPYLGFKLKHLFKHGINMVGSLYPDAWAIQYEVNDLDGMARAFSALANNNNLENQIDARAEVIEKFKCDGAVYHMNRSCKVMDFLQYEIQRKVQEKTGKPYVGFDGDQADPRNFTEAQFETRIQGLAEVMEDMKKVGGAVNE